MSNETKAVGIAPNNARCDCEDSRCRAHKAGECRREGRFLTEAYGLKQTLCPVCFSVARRLGEGR